MKRDITPPLRDPEPRARGGMTVVDRSAWLAAINAAGDGPRSAALETGGYLRCARFVNIVEAEAFGAFVERWVHKHPDDVFEGACGTFDAPSPEAAAVLRDHWIFGPRFWAWWQGRQKPAKAPEPERPRLRDSYEPQVSPQGLTTEPPRDPYAFPVGFVLTPEGKLGQPLYAPDPAPDPRPALTLADGSTVRADEVYEWSRGGDVPWPRVALAGSAGFRLSGSTGFWERAPDVTGRECGDSVWTRVYPPAETKPGPAGTVNAHGVDVSKVRAGDYARHVNWGWCLVRAADRAKDGPSSDCIPVVAPVKHQHVIGIHPSAITDHRPAPRITLPDGREVVPERMWERRPEFGRYEVAQVGDGPRGYVERVDDSFPWGFDGAWAAEPDPAYYRRTWPPADAECA